MLSPRASVCVCAFSKRALGLLPSPCLHTGWHGCTGVNWHMVSDHWWHTFPAKVCGFYADASQNEPPRVICSDTYRSRDSQALLALITPSAPIPLPPNTFAPPPDGWCPNPYPSSCSFSFSSWASDPEEAAVRKRLWPRSQGCPGWRHFSDSRDTFYSEGPSSGAEDRLWRLSHSWSSALRAGLPAPPAPRMGAGHSRLLSLDVPGPAHPSSPPAPARTASPAPLPPPIPPPKWCLPPAAGTLADPQHLSLLQGCSLLHYLPAEEGKLYTHIFICET